MQHAFNFTKKRPILRIVLLANNLKVAGGLSVGRNIVSTLPNIAPEHEYFIVVPSGCGYPSFEGSPGVHVREISATGGLRRLALDYLSLPRLVKKFQPDWIWGLGNLGLENPPSSQAILFHDSHLVYPESHYAFESTLYKYKKRLLKRRLRKCLPITDLVFCQTETARIRFADTFDYPIGQIYLCPNAVSEFSQDVTLPSVPDPLQPYQDRFKLFTLTKCYGHKNLSGILDLYSAHREALSNTLCIWTIQADQHRIAPALLQRIKDEGLGDLIVNVGPLGQEELANYFNASDAVFLPTLLESFSGTYLEAMHFGRPIITSDLDFARDVCGDAAAYCDPFDIQSMCDTVLQLKESSRLRQELVAAGQSRLKTMFRTWPDILRSALDAMGISHD